MKKALAIYLVLCLLLCGCGTEVPSDAEKPSVTNEQSEVTSGVDVPDEPPKAEDTEDDSTPEEVEEPDFCELVFRQAQIESVQVPGMGSYSVPANEEEKEAILQSLLNVDIDTFEDCEFESTGGSVYFGLTTDLGEYTVLIENGADAQYLSISKLDMESHRTQRQRKVCPSGSFDYKELEQLSENVLYNADDPEYSGIIADAETGEELKKLFKGLTFQLMGYFDSAIMLSEMPEDDSILYDITLTVGETVYGIDLTTRQFYREISGERQYAQLDEGLFTMVKIATNDIPGIGEES